MSVEAPNPVVTAQTPAEALTLLRDAARPVSVVVYGSLYADRFPGITDYYADAHAACRTQELADRIFVRYAGPEREYQDAWVEKPLEEFPQVSLTRTVGPSDILSKAQAESIAANALATLQGQIHILLNSPAPAE
ncbi:hypothetical protein HYS93_03885 [Candidatus Daviesbacteria bacterium]|nr:hypothetical protein [Candidatus Daviesbacteria bacterium]